MSNPLGALKDEEHNILCRRYILFSRNCLDLTELLQCVIMYARAKEKDDREIAVSLPPDAINLSILHHYTTPKILTCQDFLQGIASIAQKFCLTKGHENDYKWTNSENADDQRNGQNWNLAGNSAAALGCRESASGSKSRKSIACQF